MHLERDQFYAGMVNQTFFFHKIQTMQEIIEKRIFEDAFQLSSQFPGTYILVLKKTHYVFV